MNILTQDFQVISCTFLQDLNLYCALVWTCSNQGVSQLDYYSGLHYTSKMARLSRIVIPNQPLHIMHRGNNRQNIFESEKDMVRIKEDIKVSLSKSGCSLHAYVIMTNHLHLLITPQNKAQLATFMQSVANRYVRYFNVLHQRTGTLWEGRFKSCLVDSDHYLFALYKYID